jgi:hypothetical protein
MGFPRLGLHFSGQVVGNSQDEPLHEKIVIRDRPQRNTEFDECRWRSFSSGDRLSPVDFPSGTPPGRIQHILIIPPRAISKSHSSPGARWGVARDLLVRRWTRERWTISERAGELPCGSVAKPSPRWMIRPVSSGGIGGSGDAGFMGMLLNREGRDLGRFAKERL